MLARDGEGAVIAGGCLVGGAAYREKQVAVEPVEVVEERLARPSGDDQAVATPCASASWPAGRCAWPERQAPGEPPVPRLGRERQAVMISGRAAVSPAVTRAAAGGGRHRARGETLRPLSATTSRRAPLRGNVSADQWTIVSKKSVYASKLALEPAREG
jgi:hypothetical protein